MTDYTHNFEADTGNILNIVINSLYSDRDIFLRELLSNASDAIHKRKLLGQTNQALLNTSDDQINVVVDAKKKTIQLTDTGIGLDEVELSQTLGTIARSGTSTFLDDVGELEDFKDAAKTLIGKFGVGFYSAFMVADKVSVVTRKAGTDQGFVWESDGKTGFSIVAAEQVGEVGTSITLHLRKDAKEYADASKLRGLILKYSDHIVFPILIKDEGSENEQVNSAKALWTKPAAEISQDEYTEFYKATCMVYEEPYIVIHNKAEGTIEFTNLLFVPKTAPFDLFAPDRKTKVSLYINRVFISQNIDGIIPNWLRFIQGILDTTSLDLNVSREMVQNSPVIKKISKSLTKRILSELKKKLAQDEDGYDAFWAQFGKVLKEGLYDDPENREKLAELVKVYSFKHDKLITLQSYIDEMAEKQESIYCLTADTLKQAKSSPHLEGFKAKGLDVALMTDPIDAFWIAQMGSFKGKPFLSISRDKYDLSDIGAEADDAKNEAIDDAMADTAIAVIKGCLGDMVEDVRASKSLVESPVRLVAGDGGLDFNLERILKAQNAEFEGSKKVLEINVGHELVMKISSLPADVQASFCRVLFEQARILDGEMPSDPQQFSKDIMQIGARL
jgi:molecular chaperone HtpG